MIRDKHKWKESRCGVYKIVVLAEINGYYLKFNKQLARISKCYGDTLWGIVQYIYRELELY